MDVIGVFHKRVYCCRCNRYEVRRRASGVEASPLVSKVAYGLRNSGTRELAAIDKCQGISTARRTIQRLGEGFSPRLFRRFDSIDVRKITCLASARSASGPAQQQ